MESFHDVKGLEHDATSVQAVRKHGEEGIPIYGLVQY
jgi:hypothetical protein